MANFDTELEQEVKLSKYNNAIDQIYRLGIIWRNAYKHSSSGDFVLWNLDLDGVWRELAGDLKSDSDAETTINQINSKILEVYPLKSNNAPGFNKLPEDYMRKISKQYLLLSEKEIFLRRLQNQLGKGTAWDETDEDDFG